MAKRNVRKRVEKRINPMGEIGVTGLRQIGGRIDEEFHKNLQGDRAVEVYTEMIYNSPTVRGVLFAIEMLMRQVKWRVDAPENVEADESVEFLEQCRNDMSFTWEDTIAEVLSMLPYGWSYHEIVYKRRTGPDPLSPGSHSQYDDGKIGWRKLPIRAQPTRLRWEMDKQGGIAGMWQQDLMAGQAPVFIPIEKALLFRANMHKNNPEGLSVLRAAYRPWYYSTRMEEIEAIGVERDLTGYPVAKIPGDHITGNTATFQAWKKAIRNMRRNEQEGLIIPSEVDETTKMPLYDVALLTTPGQRTIDTDPIIQRYEKRIAMTMLADFLFLGQDKVGSYALSGNKMSLFGVALSAWADEIAAVFNRHAVPRLMALNGFPLEAMPRICHEPIEVLDLSILADVIGKLTTAGMPLFPDPKVENVLRKLLDLPEMTEEEIDVRAEEDEERKELALETERQAAAQTAADVKATEADAKRPAAKIALVKEAEPKVEQKVEHHHHTHLPEVKVQLNPEVKVDVPKADAPVVHVAAPQVTVQAPDVHVAPAQVTVKAQMPDQPAPQVTVKVEESEMEITHERDDAGRVKKSTKRKRKPE